MNQKKKDAKDAIVQGAMISVSPLGYLLYKGVETSINTILSKKDPVELEEEVTKQETIAKASITQAKIAQELAIAERIRTAETVEIEEIYEGTGKGGLSVDYSATGIGGKLSGEGSRVSKRIYRFNGWHEGAQQTNNQDFQNDEIESDDEE